MCYLKILTLRPFSQAACKAYSLCRVIWLHQVTIVVIASLHLQLRYYKSGTRYCNKPVTSNFHWRAFNSSNPCPLDYFSVIPMEQIVVGWKGCRKTNCFPQTNFTAFQMLGEVHISRNVMGTWGECRNDHTTWPFSYKKVWKNMHWKAQTKWRSLLTHSHEAGRSHTYSA